LQIRARQEEHDQPGTAGVYLCVGRVTKRCEDLRDMTNPFILFGRDRSLDASQANKAQQQEATTTGRTKNVPGQKQGSLPRGKRRGKKGV